MSYPKQPVYSTNQQPIASVIRSPLLQAIDQNSVGTCEELIQSNADVVHEVGWNDLTPLHQVCLRGQLEIMHLLMRNGVKLDARSSFGETPLHYACRRGDLRIIHVLISAGADVMSVDKQGRSCIHFTALGGNIPAMHYLNTQTDLSLDAQDQIGDTALHIACIHRHFPLVDYLLRKNRSRVEIQNNKGLTVLHIAALMGNIEMVWRIIEKSHCGLIHVQDENGRTPLDVARKEVTPRHKDVADTLGHYASKPRDSPASGPTFTWWFLLLLPFSYTTFVLIIASFFNSHAGHFAAAMSLLLLVIIYRQSHRIQHAARWPNPIFLGFFAGGIIHCLIAGLFKLTYDFWPCYGLLFTILIFGGGGLWYLYDLVVKDPGFVLHPRSENGHELGVLDIAVGKCKENDFCPFTEMIRPERTKFCKLCERLVQGLDHHCLFIMNCVAINNHRNFIFFLIDVMLLQILFLYYSWLYIVSFYPNSVEESTPSLMLHYEPWLLVLCMLCIAAFVWESTLMFDQFRNIIRGQTTYYSMPRTRVTFREGFRNIYMFFCHPKQRFVKIYSTLKPF